MNVSEHWAAYVAEQVHEKKTRNDEGSDVVGRNLIVSAGVISDGAQREEQTGGNQAHHLADSRSREAAVVNAPTNGEGSPDLEPVGSVLNPSTAVALRGSGLAGTQVELGAVAMNGGNGVTSARSEHCSNPSLRSNAPRYNGIVLRF